MAEQRVMTKVEDIIKCAMCLEVLTDPKTFNCLHSYCRKCIKGLKKSKKEDVTGYACPECRRFTPQDEVRVVHLVIQLLDAYHAATRSPGEAKCHRCSKEQAKWCCMDCTSRTSLCDGCKRLHDEFVKHQVLSMEELKDERRVLEKPMFCTEHKENKIEVFCTQCDKTMCVLCKIFTHDGHKAEPIADALKRLLPEISSRKDEIKENIKENKEEIASLKKEKEEIIKKYDNDIQEISDKINEQNQVVAWVNTTVARTKGVTLLQEIQDGLLEKVNFLASEPGYASSKSGFRVNSSRCWPWLVANTQGTLTLKQTIQLTNPGGPHPYTRIGILWDQVWMTAHPTRQIYKYGFDGTQAGTLQLDGSVTTPRNVIQTGKTEAIVVAQSGLYTIKEEGRIKTTLQQGDFSDACLATNGKLYALEYRQGKVMVFTKSGGTWKKQEELTLQNYQNENGISGQNYVNTMVVKDKNIYVSLISNNRIMCYDMTGTKVREIGSGQLNLPSVVGIDQNNTLLVANYNLVRIDQFDLNGTRTQLPGFASYHPWYAAYSNEKTLWVIESANRLLRYSYE